MSEGRKIWIAELKVAVDKAHAAYRAAEREWKKAAVKKDEATDLNQIRNLEQKEGLALRNLESAREVYEDKAREALESFKRGDEDDC